MNHTAGEQLRKIYPDDIIWIVTVFPPGELTLIGRLEVGERTNRKDAMRQLNADNLWPAKHHVIAKLGTEEPLRAVSLASIAEDLRFESSRDRLNVVSGRVNGGQLQAMRLLTPSSVTLVKREWYGNDTPDISEAEKQISVGAGFGNAEINDKVMRAGVAFITEWYETRGWDVKSVEAERCGYDLLCMKGSAKEHVEVKGIKGTVLSFIITSGEVRQARTNRHFILCAVTSALSDTPHMFRYTGQEFIQKFKLEALAYRASLHK